MLLEVTLGDGVSLARSVRAVASQARRTLNRPSDQNETRELLRAIGNLEREAEECSSQDVSRWVGNLRRQIERHAILSD